MKDRLISLSKEILKNAYVPYSKFQVGAALVTIRGNVFTGCNVENASFGLSCCAERNAVFAAVSLEGPTMQIKEIAVTTNPPSLASPCGACRQVMYEFGKEMTLWICRADGTYTGATIRDLLPLTFKF